MPYNEALEDGKPRPIYRTLFERLWQIGPTGLARRLARAQQIAREEAVTYLLEGGEERICPVDWIPRLLSAADFRRIEAGLKQRVAALNLFCRDVYNGRQEIVPEEILKTSLYYYPECEGLRPPKDIYVHVYGPDLVCLGPEKFVVLEDNLRVPSGVSYAYKYREILKRAFPELFAGPPIRKIDDYCRIFLKILEQVAPLASGRGGPLIVLLTEGSRNPAYFEHRFLAEQMGIPLVEASDLYVDSDGICWMRTYAEPRRVDVIYRRIQDIDVFVPDLSRACALGHVALVNAWGAGIVDDKAVFPYVPKIIRHYLGEDPILENAPTYSLTDPKVRTWVLERLDKMVIKPREGSGGHGVLIGPESTKSQRDEVRDRILAHPLGYIAQDCLDFSQHPLLSLADGWISLPPAFVDLRTYVLTGAEETYVLPGGITRVAPPGTRIVNSSAGGLIKDTWVLAE